MTSREIPLRPCTAADVERVGSIVNAAAARYEGVIPADRWHQPYMPPDELRAEIAAGVRFTGAEADGELVGVMGVQRVRNVTLIRHAYVVPDRQGLGIGGRLLEELVPANASGQVLIGTWAAADWAIAFYRRHGFATVSRTAATTLLRTYWTVSERQIETSVVLARPTLDDEAVGRLVVGAVDEGGDRR